jgi:hypothetical protein
MAHPDTTQTFNVIPLRISDVLMCQSFENLQDYSITMRNIFIHQLRSVLKKGPQQARATSFRQKENFVYLEYNNAGDSESSDTQTALVSNTFISLNRNEAKILAGRTVSHRSYAREVSAQTR